MRQNLNKSLFPRKALENIVKFLDTEEVIVLIGARQVGKTCIMRLLQNELRKRGIDEKIIHYFDLEDTSLLKILNAGPEEFLRYLSSLGADISGNLVVFIDEIQYLDNPSNFIKLLSDHHKNIKLVVSGSSTFDIRKKFKDSLAGRKIVFEIFPLDFQEFLLFRGEKILYDLLLRNSFEKIYREKIKPDFEELKFHSEKFKRLIDEFIVYGGYPRIALENNNGKKITYLAEIYNTYVKKDIKDLMRIDNPAAFNNLIKILGLQAGDLMNYDNTSIDLRMARPTLERYLFILKNTFIIEILAPYFTNKRKEIVKMPKIYFFDNGLRNAAINNFLPADSRTDTGVLVENFVFSQLIKNLRDLEELHFWRTQSKNEIDFIISGQNPVPVEVKYKSFKFPAVPRGMKYFLKNYLPPRGFVLTKDFFGMKEEEGRPIYFLPVWM
ncbi:hypothetical protein COY52_05015 [Candidatus Desantisbacteria bacterium CG_4_10_14_0_8_um_filter_48_22]|uniref:AAA+ ATPase domain-containing protein n=1 Tax=Candidatus Desantisbacteria bacterium CG_4_10_14_0_8_um_filter_48_22 TaxID=1974543 RepID=A0A2M7SD59_9BACT|nr:MAG: hypothetical protein AUJ67_08085 [Candidatus Desantisbacteria bacterium CG1_02_49_89]PIV55028.1 MAG: hypothetical protein COS16_08580 [Candidatus Desantisbacteria bacterium CG02_land_8_20_14_3_00_49_13]PIZ17203.1 MAG: hypothetical protein COY52_05015 [Candidatus Desantisbacteria bacterium CG_4_10_14_0_8_um_filter_48_22]